MKKITPIKKFDFAIERAEHLLFLYEVLHNRRQRRPRPSWMIKFKKLMLWRQSDSVLRIDGKDSMLILRNPSEGMTITRFEHKYLEELLRAAVVASVSALDKFMHDWALDVTFNLLQGREDKIPKDLKKLEVPALESLKSMKQIRKDKNARPGSQIKLAIQNKLHKSTYQGSSGIDNCVKLMGVSNFWQQTCKGLQESAKPEDAQEQINKIVQRRNAIVHEADLPRRISAQTIKCNEIKYKDAKNYVKFIRDFVTSANEVFEAST